MADEVRVLIVDDDLSVQTSLCAFLEDEGFVPLCTGSATQALEMIAREQVDVVVVDLRLIEMSGEQLIVRAQKIRPAARFLIFTGSLGYQLPDSLAAIGIKQADILHKPLRHMTILADQIRCLSGKEGGNVHR